MRSAADDVQMTCACADDVQVWTMCKRHVCADNVDVMLGVVLHEIRQLRPEEAILNSSA